MPVAESDQQLRQIQKSIELGDYEAALTSFQPAGI